MQQQRFEGTNLLFCDGHVKFTRIEDATYGAGGSAGSGDSSTDPKFLWNRL